ncbi:LamG-like jellyroll fold domain-containing protein [Actinokineospora globicatena]|uniref:Concanavalin A-like lectin/glucanases superfamily protein n=1 Tax=Actinokineospora globicatena TaxID=103729 RepID=A0A9W6QIM7_9PSEU|nr:LamG-like jellyroll fold domain-containing protein [Actinokineospora globicatena]GLW89287.1 hypothetical protein Aglo03_01030 [Actinokineospora globicatena]
MSAAGVWTLLTGVYDNPSRQIKLYVDGRLTATKTFTGTPWNASGSVTVGTHTVNGSDTAFLKGTVDTVRIWQLALTTSQVAGTAGLSYADSVWTGGVQGSATPVGPLTLTAGSGVAAAQFNGTSHRRYRGQAAFRQVVSGPSLFPNLYQLLQLCPKRRTCGQGTVDPPRGHL